MKRISFIPLVLILSLPLKAGPFLDLETGPVFTGLNDARIPARYGTRFSFPGVFGNTPWYFIRAKAGYTVAERHSLFFLAAPLKIDYEGTPSGFLIFKHRIFLPAFPTTASFMFNSWRFTYRYDIVSNERIRFGIGLTAKIRDAYIRLRQSGRHTTRRDLGFVPLINVRLAWMFDPSWSLVIDADWLAAPQGRAEDVTAAVQYRINDRVSVRAGYRILEGGAKNSRVYTFSLFHYAVAGTTVSF